MKSPLRKRIPRELKGEIGKYLVVFILMVATIGMVSGFLVADGSMIQAYDEGFEKYNIEDGNFRTGERLYRGQREAIEEEGVKIYENYYIEDSLSNGSTMRFFKNRTEVDKVCLMDGELPLEILWMMGQSPGRSPGWLHYQITAVCFRIITILCLML